MKNDMHLENTRSVTSEYNETMKKFAYASWRDILKEAEIFISEKDKIHIKIGNTTIRNNI
jgi:hypothetical protein